MSSYLTVTANDFFLFKSSEEKGVYESVFQDYCKTNHVAGKDNYAKIFHGNY